MKIRQKIVISLIKTGRKFLANTPVNNWALAGKAKGILFKQLQKGDEVEAIYKGIKIIAPTKDVSLTPGLVGGYYESAELDIFKALAKKAKLIVDVGGNIGLYAVLGAKSVPRNSRVLSFEPIPENVSYIRRNARLNEIGNNLIIEQFAVGNSSNELTIYVSKNNVGNHSAAKKNVSDAVGEQIVRQITLDDYFAKHKKQYGAPDILKIDIEGYDGFAIEGAIELIKKYKPTLLVEFIPRLLKNCNYDPVNYAKLLFGVYPTCYLVDEVKNKVHRVEQDSLDNFTKRVSNSNLIFVSRSEHEEIIVNYLGA